MCGSGPLLILNPNLSEKRKPKKYSPDSVKRPGKPTLQIGKEAAPNLPAVATEAKEEIIEGYLREWERAGVSPKGPQCSPQIFSQLEHRCST